MVAALLVIRHRIQPVLKESDLTFRSNLKWIITGLCSCRTLNLATN